MLLQKTEQEQTYENNTLLQLNEFFVKSIPSGKLLRYNGVIDKSVVAHFDGGATIGGIYHKRIDEICQQKRIP